MKKTDMELQAIREKLLSLKAEPPATEAVPMPWSQPKPPGAALPYNRPAQVVEALQQRSSSAGPAAPAQADSLIAQEIHRLEVQAHDINTRSQQQAADLKAIKRLAQQAAIALARQGIHDHPQLEAITQFFADYQSAVVPRIDRDAQGSFVLSYSPVDFDDADHVAAAIAQSLRQRSKPGLFSQPTESAGAASGRPLMEGAAEKRDQKGNKPDPATAIYSAALENEWLQTAAERAVHRFRRLRAQAQRHRRQNVQVKRQGNAVNPLNLEGKDQFASQSVSKRFASSQYSLFDGAIWFSSAAIVLLVIKAMAVGYAHIGTLVIVALVGVTCFALYQVMFSQSSNYSLLYRLCAAMLGLFLASFLNSPF